MLFSQGPPDGPRGGTPPDPQAMIQMRVNFLASRLSLTDAQKTKATSIFTDASTANQSVRTSMQSNRQSLLDAVKKNDTAAIDQLSVTAGTLTGQLTAIEMKAEAAFYATLTADQQAKYDEMPRGGPMRGGFGRGGFRGSRQ
jgi:Spy/CpxP family protein refolding chaperone